MKHRRLIIAVASMVMVALVAFAAVVALLSSERGTRQSLLIAQSWLPQLRIEGERGSWLRGLRIERLTWRTDDTEVRVDDIDLRLRWTNLLRGEVHLSRLHASALRIASFGEDDDSPIVLPAISLPITLSTANLAIAKLDIVSADSTFTIDAIESRVRWRAHTIRVRNLRAGWTDVNVQADGRIELRRDYPLQLTGSLSTPQIGAPVAFVTAGDLRDLRIQATAERPYAIRADIRLATLDEELPLEVMAQLTQPVTQEVGGTELKIETAVLRAEGTLARIDATLRASLNETHYGSAQLEASAQWQPESAQLQGRLDLGSDSSSNASANGSFEFDCTATLVPTEHVTCEGQARTINLTPLLTEQTGDIAGILNLEASRSDAQWSLALQLRDVRGHLDAETITAQADIASPDLELWQVRQLKIASGPNSASASGEVGSRNRLQLDIAAPNLTRLHPQIRGAIEANVLFSGEWPQLDLRGNWRASDVRYQEFRVARSTADFTVRKLGLEDSLGRFSAHGMRLGDQLPIDLTLELNGQRALQHLALDATQGAHSLRVRCDSASVVNLNNWKIGCKEISGVVRGQGIDETWRNTAPLDGRLRVDPEADTKLVEAELAPFCLQASEAELCLDQPLRYARAQWQPTALHGARLPLHWLSTWLPQGLRLTNDARAELQANLRSLSPLRADARVSIPSTQWEWDTGRGTESAALNAIALDAALAEKRADVNASASSPTLGDISLQLGINDPRSQRQLDGRLQLQRIQLAGLAWLVTGIDDIRGEINGDVSIAGVASAPQLSGVILLKEGQASWGPLGAPFRDIHADLTFDNNSARLGGWFALGDGGGDIDGNIRWQGMADDWQLQLALVAGGLSALPLPDSKVVFSPHVNITAQPGEMHIDGYFDIAQAEIQLKQLPPDTTDVSQDQRLVGEAVAEETSVWANLGINLGDKFHFGGFGADVNLSGRLQLSKAPGDSVHLTGEVRVPRGRYRAYGQRLSVRSGSFIFYGPPDNPDLNLEAVREMPPGVTDVVGLRVIGSLKTPEALLFAEPSMPDSDIAYYLLTGRRPVSGSTTQLSASGALLSLGMAGSEDRAGKLAERFGIRDLQLGTTEDADGNTEAEISGQLGRDLYVRYGRGFGQRSNSISFQYRLTPRLMIETISGVEDALDLLYSFEIQ